MARFIIRIDDFPFALVNDPRVVYEDRLSNQIKLHEFFKARNIPYILGVVPAHIMTPDIDLLRQQESEGLLTVATHGYDHHHLGTYYNIFKEKSGNIIGLLFKAGLSKLSGLGNKIYIAPFNESDTLLTSALITLGFQQIYGGDMIEPDNPLSPFVTHRVAGTDVSILQVCPEHRFYGTSDVLIKNLETWKEDDEIHSLTLHWTWEISLLQQNFNSLNILLDRIKGKCISYKEIII